MTGRVLAVDVGTRRLGVAVSDPTGTVASPLTTLLRRTPAEDAKALAALADERLSTVAAERALVGGGMRRRARREVVDQVAASVFLQTWLDARRREGQGR